MIKHVKNKTPRPSDMIALGFPRDLEDAIMWCLNKDPDERPQFIHELMLKLQKCKCYQQWQVRSTVFREQYIHSDRTIILKPNETSNNTIVLNLHNLDTEKMGVGPYPKV